MADVAASVLALRTHSMPLLAHLEELRNESSSRSLAYSSDLSHAGPLQVAFSV